MERTDSGVNLEKIGVFGAWKIEGGKERIVLYVVVQPALRAGPGAHHFLGMNEGKEAGVLEDMGVRLIHLRSSCNCSSSMALMISTPLAK